ncbi:MAG: hypothetical protein WCC59_12555 [Terriglobales bacterium]
MPRAALRLFLILAVMSAAVPALAVQHATEGVITRVDSAARTIAVKTADGAVEVFKFTGKTAVHAAQGVKTGAVASYLAGKKGTHVVVHYTEEGADKTAVGFDDFGKDSVKVGKGTITDLDKAGHTVTVKTEDGSQQTYHVAKDAAVDTEHGVVKGAEYEAKKGEKVSVHYTEEGGHKIAHFIKRM